MDKLIRKSSVIWFGPLLYFAAVETLLWIKKPALLLSQELLLNRLVFLGVFIASLVIQKRASTKNRDFGLTLVLYVLLTLLYKETATLNQLFYPVIDQTLMDWDQLLFGFQPALQFSKSFSNPVLSELLFFGYFSYYLMPIIILLLLYKKYPYLLRPFGFTLIFSFLTYYFLFIIFPAVGPQFYWKSPENSISAQGFFGKLIKFIQANGEAKTAAFPSSHVGMAVLLLLWMHKNKIKPYWLYFLPNVVLLIFATVYIKAHYVIDILVGIISAPVILALSESTYRLATQKLIKLYR